MKRLVGSLALAMAFLGLFLWLAPPAFSQGGCEPMENHPFFSSLQIAGDNLTVYENSISVDSYGYLNVDIEATGYYENEYLGAVMYIGNLGDKRIVSVTLQSDLTYTQWVIWDGVQDWEEYLYFNNFFGWEITPTAGLVLSRTFVGWQWGEYSEYGYWYTSVGASNQGVMDYVYASLHAKMIVLPEGCSLPVVYTETYPYCGVNGIELITVTGGIPITPTPGIGSWGWTDSVTTTFDHIRATFTWSNTTGYDYFYGTTKLNGTRVELSYLDKPWDILTATIPTPGGVWRTLGPLAELAFKSQEQVQLLSVCVEDDDVPLRSLSCNLRNWDFAEGLAGWDTFGDSVLYEPSQGSYGSAWLMQLNFTTIPLLLQDELRDDNISYRMIIRTRAYQTETNSLDFGLINDVGGENIEQRFTVYPDEQWRTFSAVVSVTSNSAVFVQAQSNYLDYVCLQTYDPGDYLPDITCVAPTLDDHPDFEITELPEWITWLARKILEGLEWLACLLKQIIFEAINRILEAIYTKILAPGTDWTGFPTWLGNLIKMVVNWFRQGGMNFGEFLLNLVKEFVAWIADQLGIDVTWFFEALDSLIENFDDFRAAIMAEVVAEWEDLVSLTSATSDVFGEMVTGFRTSLSGSDTADLGLRSTGTGGFLYRGLQFVNTNLQNTPVLALNLIGLGIVLWSLVIWTIKKFIGSLNRWV